MSEQVLTSLLNGVKSKIFLLVFDGLGGLPHPDTGKTELETANSPNLNRWAREGATGLVDPVGPGITPGSGPAHLALFGYDPIRDNVGRGVLSALGAGLEMTDRDVAARINFATRDANGHITDRRAGRISSDEGKRVTQKLVEGVSIDGVEVTLRAEKEHRAVVVFRADGLAGELGDTDPQATGVPARDPAPLVDSPAHRRTAEIASEFIRQAREILKDETAANDVLLRGFAGWDPPASFEKRFGLEAAAIAMYPMYRGLARLVGMEALPQASSIEEEFEMLPGAFANADYVYLHIKQTDSAGEDGDFDRKVAVIEQVDAILPSIESLADVILVTGDHSTPSLMKAHSFHPVPLLMRGGDTYVDPSQDFGETTCRTGALGRFPSRHLMALALSTAGRLNKFGA